MVFSTFSISLKSLIINNIKSMKNYQVIFLTFFANISFIFSQTTINGLVSDNQGLPLPGASIVEEGTSNGTTSDFDGIFTLEVSNNSSISISYVGYQTIIISSDGDFSQIKLEESNTLDEVVVTSFGLSREKKSLGYSQQSVGGEQLVKAR